MEHDKKEVKVSLKLPDFERREIQTEIKKDSISVRAHKKLFKKIRKKGFFHSEKTEKSFDYTTNVPEINPRKVKIEFKKGVLRIKSPRV